MLFREVDALLRQDKFEECDEVLRTLNPALLDTHLAVASLAITLAAKDRLRRRARFAELVEMRLREEIADRTDLLLAGLR